ncbi:hypothetical protein FRC03_011351 [Tulasnella sp. 419]|nr:hypothetical protein FRC03_011351 [Tulasnella sp. 419]
MEIDRRDEIYPMNGSLHFYPYLEHLSISVHGHSLASVQRPMRHMCFPSDEHTPQGLALPQLRSFTLKGLEELSILDGLVKAKYGSSEADLMDSPLFRELAIFTIHLVHPSDERLKMELESYFRSRNVQFKVVV